MCSCFCWLFHYYVFAMRNGLNCFLCNLHNQQKITLCKNVLTATFDWECIWRINSRTHADSEKKHYLNEHNASHSLEEQQGSHGESVDPGVVLDVGVQSHAAAHHALIPLQHRHVLKTHRHITLETRTSRAGFQPTVAANKSHPQSCLQKAAVFFFLPQQEAASPSTSVAAIFPQSKSCSLWHF